MPENRTIWKSNNQGVKEETFIHTGRRGKMGSQVERICSKVVPGRTIGEWDRLRNPGFQCGEIKPQNFSLKKCVGVVVAGETPSLTGEFIGETPRVLECTLNHPPGNQHEKCPICLWVAEEVTESRWTVEQAALFPLRPLPHIQCHNTVTWVTLPWWIPKALPLAT